MLPLGKGLVRLSGDWRYYDSFDLLYDRDGRTSDHSSGFIVWRPNHADQCGWNAGCYI